MGKFNIAEAAQKAAQQVKGGKAKKAASGDPLEGLNAEAVQLFKGLEARGMKPNRPGTQVNGGKWLVPIRGAFLAALLPAFIAAEQVGKAEGEKAGAEAGKAYDDELLAAGVLPANRTDAQKEARTELVDLVRASIAAEAEAEAFTAIVAAGIKATQPAPKQPAGAQPKPGKAA